MERKGPAFLVATSTTFVVTTRNSVPGELSSNSALVFEGQCDFDSHFSFSRNRNGTHLVGLLWGGDGTISITW